MFEVKNNRRGFFGSAGKIVLATTLCNLPSAQAQSEPYADPVAADKWLAPWLHAPGAVAGALHMGRFADRTYYLDKEISWSPSPGQEGAPAVTVPAGFVTDLASIPRIFWSVLPTDGIYTFPAIVHDYLYWMQSTSREVADLIFKYGMEDMKVSSPTVFAIHKAVRLGGGGPWKDNAKKKANGERRVLAQFPDKPTTTWAEWKAIPGVLK